MTRPDGAGSAEIAELVAGAAERAISSAELGKMPVPEVAPELGISSPAGPEMLEQKGFWFSVNAELVIYGATEPDAQVSIGGRPIRLRPDGTFSYRFSLPDGSYTLPIAARAAHGEVRRAELRFYRGTRYEGEVGAHPQDPGLKPPEVENLS
jgi:hypothetical protein